MLSLKATVTNAGATLLQNASAASPLTITRVTVAQVVTTPVAGQLIAPNPAATSMAQAKYNVDTGIFVSRNLTGNAFAVRFKIPEISFGYWVLQFGIFSGATLLAIASIEAHERTASTGDKEYAVLVPVSDLAKVVKNRNSLSLASKATMDAIKTEMGTRHVAAFPPGPEGSTYKVVGGQVQPQRLLELCTVTEQGGEFEAEKLNLISARDINANWYRFSHSTSAGTGQPAFPETNSFYIGYDATEDVMTSGTNSGNGLSGIVSKKRYDKYTFALELSATDQDDDELGMVVAFVRDAVGFEHKLCVVRCPGGMGHTFSVIKNHYSTQGIKVLHKSTKIAWGNGGYGLTPSEAGYVTGVQAHSWQALGKCRVKAVRNGDIITISASEFGPNNTVYKADATVTIDLSSDPDLEVFRQPCSIGFFRQHQNMGKFKIIEFSDPVKTIVDLFSFRMAKRDPNLGWTELNFQSLGAVSAELGLGKIIHCRANNKSYLTHPNDLFRIF